jgi:hypothetical protein
MTEPIWTPAVGDPVIVDGMSMLSTSYTVTRVGTDLLGPYAWLRSRGRQQIEAQARWYRNRWTVTGVGEMTPLSAPARAKRGVAMSELADLQTMYEKSVEQLEHLGLKPTMVVQYDGPVDGLLDAYFASNTPDHYAGEPPMSLIDAQVAAYTTNTATLDAYHELQLRLPGDPMWGSGPKD